MSLVSLDAQAHVLAMGLDRAAKMNAFTLPMLRELAEAYTRLESDPELRVGVLFAHGDHFTAGLDLADVGPAVAQGGTVFPDGLVDPLDVFGVRRTKPVVCAVRGVCFTIGIELLLAADISICGASTRFAQMEVRRGIMPFGGATLRFEAVAGRARAMKWLLTGDEFGAEEALAMGLVAEVVPDEAVTARGMELAIRVASRAPRAVQATLRSARTAVEEGRDRAIAELMPLARSLFASDDAREGLRSFIERREARFTGK